MQWNKVNISKDELKKRQEKYIKEAIEISRKSRATEDISVPVIISIPKTQGPEDNTVETAEIVPISEIEENDAAETISDSPSDTEKATEETDTTQAIADIDKSDEIDTTASEEISDDTEKEDTPQALFDNVFITEEEAGVYNLSEAGISANKAICIDKPEELPESAAIKWYKYNKILTLLSEL